MAGVVPDAAECSGVRLCVSLAFGFAPTFNRASTLAGVPLNAASCSGVCPFASLAFGFAPTFNRASTLAGVPLTAASCSGVYPKASLAFGFAPRADSWMAAEHVPTKRDTPSKAPARLRVKPHALIG